VARGGFLITSADIAAGGPDLLRLGTAHADGIRSTGDGYLVVTGLDGVIFSIDLAGVAAGVGDEDITILYEDRIGGRELSFDDLTPMSPPPTESLIPEPTTMVLAVIGLLGVGRKARKRRST